MFVPVRSLPQPVTLDLAVQGPGISTLVHRQAQLSIEVQIPAGHMRLRNLHWLIYEQEMDEVLLGRPVLHAFGIDAEAYLIAAREESPVPQPDPLESAIRSHPWPRTTLTRSFMVSLTWIPSAILVFSISLRHLPMRP
jgi:hypothetical protein